MTFQQCNIINIELKIIVIWCKLNKLSIDVKKTNLIIFCFKNIKLPNNLSLVLDNTTTEQVDKTKFLGVVKHSK